MLELPAAGNLGALLALLAVVLQAVMAVVVHGDARQVQQGGGRLFLFSPLIWGGMVFVFGVFGLGLYWLVHYSKLKQA